MLKVAKSRGFSRFGVENVLKFKLNTFLNAQREDKALSVSGEFFLVATISILAIRSHTLNYSFTKQVE